MLAAMAVGEKNLHVRPSSPGDAIAARRRWLGLTAEELVEQSNDEISLKLLSQLENNRYGLENLRLSKYKALLNVLRWTPAQFEEATGVPRLLSDPLPGAEEYEPTLRIPIIGTVSAGLSAIEEIVEAETFLSIDPRVAPHQLASAPPGSLYALLVNGDSMVSDFAAKEVRHGSHVVVEVGAAPTHGNLVVAWLPTREILVVKAYQEGSDVVLRSYNPRGPIFRLGAEPVEIRGVVRMVVSYPG